MNLVMSACRRLSGIGSAMVGWQGGLRRSSLEVHSLQRTRGELKTRRMCRAGRNRRDFGGRTLTGRTCDEGCNAEMLETCSWTSCCISLSVQCPHCTYLGHGTTGGEGGHRMQRWRYISHVPSSLLVACGGGKALEATYIPAPHRSAGQASIRTDFLIEGVAQAPTAGVGSWLASLPQCTMHGALQSSQWLPVIDWKFPRFHSRSN